MLSTIGFQNHAATFPSKFNRLEAIVEFEVNNRLSVVNSISACPRCGILVDLEAGDRNLPTLQEVLTKILQICDGLRRFY